MVLVTQVEQLHGCLAQIGRNLERAEAVLSTVALLPAMLKSTPTSCSPCEVSVDSVEDRGEKLYGSFSPRVEDNSLSLYALSSVFCSHITFMLYFDTHSSNDINSSVEKKNMKKIKQKKK
jgi:hypothetical protein